MAGTNSNLVTAGRPKVGGAIFVAPLGSKLPLSATEELDKSAFVSLGYISDKGVSNEDKAESKTYKAWGGDPVLVIQESKTDKFKFSMIEALNIDVLKNVYGADSVSGTLETGIKIKVNSNPKPDYSLVIDMVLKDNILKRLVIPIASVGSIGEVKYSDTDAVGYEATIICKPDAQGNTHYEYLQKAPTAGGSFA